MTGSPLLCDALSADDALLAGTFRVRGYAARFI